MQTDSTTATTDTEQAARVRAFEDELILEYLNREPLSRAAFLAVVQEEPSERADEEELLAAQRRHVERYFQAVFFGACAQCYWPIVQFVDGRGLDWPGLTLHECVGLAPSLSATRPAWWRPVEAS